MSEPPEPSFGDLLRGNLRLLRWVVVVMIAAFATWRGLVWLFPDMPWLRMPGS